MNRDELNERAVELIRSYKEDEEYSEDVLESLVDGIGMASSEDELYIVIVALYKYAIENERP